MKLVYSIKEKLKESDKERKIQLLTLVPDDWSIYRTMEFVNFSEYSVKQARKLKKEKGILATPKNYSREGINRATKLLITEFYGCDAVSRICPGKKDCVSINLEDGSKEKVQKRLLLTNLNEVYALFKSKFSNLPVSFSTFALLDPKWCIPVGVLGSHNVCVCRHNQNVKLMIYAVNPSLDYKNVLKLCVCDITNQNYIFHHCDSCPDESFVRKFLMEQLQNNNYSPGD